MSYMHIANLYKDDRILAFREVYAMEKIHGTSAHVSWHDGVVAFHHGGVKRDKFEGLFDVQKLHDAFMQITPVGHVVVYGEAYGGNCQKMSDVYGPDLKFVAFEVKIGDTWLAVPDAEKVVHSLGLEFVFYKLIPADMTHIDIERDEPSVQALRNGMGTHPREGVVLRPPFEVVLNNGKRLIAKHKNETYKEREHQPKVGADLVVLREAQAIADEWVTPMRLGHVLDALTVDGVSPGQERTGDIIKAMIADIEREAAGEVVIDKLARKRIGRKTAQMLALQSCLTKEQNQCAR